MGGGVAAVVPVVKAVGTVLGAIGAARTAFGGPEQPRAAAPQPAPAPAEAEPFTPTRPDALDRPETLSELAAFSPTQERSALATHGLNVGLGSQENAYYRNLLQRSLVGEGGQVSQDPNFLLPIEQQFFQRQGVDVSDPLRFLEGIR